MDTRSQAKRKLSATNAKSQDITRVAVPNFKKRDLRRSLKRRKV